MKKQIALVALVLAAVTASAQAETTVTASCNVHVTFAGQTRVFAKEVKFTEGESAIHYLGVYDSSAVSLTMKDGAGAAPLGMAVLAVQQGFVKRSVSTPIVNGSAVVQYEEKTVGVGSYEVRCEVTKTE